MRFKVVCNWNSDYNIYRIFNDIWNIDEKYDLTYEDDYTHLLVFNEYKGEIKTKKENVFGFIYEPTWSSNWDRNLKDYCGTVFTCEPDKYPYSNVEKSIFMPTHHLFPKPSHIGEIQHVDNNTKNIVDSKFQKDRKLSIVVSSISRYERYPFVKMLLDSDIDFDMYGRDWQISDYRYKGYVENKLDAISRYEYTICLENSSIDGLITEKFIDAILCETIPIYNGHRSVDLYYPKCSEYIDFDSKFIENIKKILEFKKEYDFDSAKNLYLNRYNPFALIKNKLNL